MKVKNILLKVMVILVLGSSGLFVLAPVSADSFNQNNIIDDAIFNNVSSMSAASIDAFLNQFPKSCISTNRGFSAPDPTGYSPTQGFTFGGNVSAGQVIYDAAQAYGLNPQVLISTLQKEQSLVVGDAGCSTLRYAAAMGYACPDGGSSYSYSGVNLYTINGTTVTSVTGTCVNSSFKVGFSQQLIRAAWLLEFGMQRSEGNIKWAVIKGSWDNSDDPQSCYGGPMTQGTWQRCPSGASVYYDGYTTIDSTAVHMDNGPTAALYWYTPHFAGNQSFFNIFTNWFGTTHAPQAFKTPDSGSVYLQASGYKFTVPSMAILQDFGIEPSAIQTIDSTTANSIPSPPSSTGLSTGLSYLVKSPSDTDSDGPTLYLISVGKRYKVTSMQQLSDFALSTNNIAYLPLSYIYSLTDGGALSNYVSTPSNNVFSVSGGRKRIIFDYPTYQSLNPGGASSLLSNYTAGLVLSDLPISNREILVGYPSGSAYLFTNNSYYTLPSMDAYNCWGFSQVLGTPLYRLTDSSYVGTFTPASTLGCSVNTDQNTNFLLNGTAKISTPPAYGVSGLTIDQNLLAIVNKLPTRNTSLRQAIKSNIGAAVWYVENGLRKPIPSMTNLTLLGLTSSQIDSLPAGAAEAIPAGSIKLGIGAAVKSIVSDTVYVVSSGGARTPFASQEDFTAYNYKWQTIESFPPNLLDQAYPATSNPVSKYLYDKRTGFIYLMDALGCFPMNSTFLTAYGQSSNTIQSNQPYLSSIFPYLNLSSCTNPSVYVKSANSDTVYWIDGGQRHPISSWSNLIKHSGSSNPYIVTLSDSTLATLPIGSGV